MRIPFISGEGPESHLPVNLFFSPAEIYGKDALVGRPGLKVFCNLNHYAPVRALGFWGNTAYAICGNKAFRISRAGNVQEIGTVWNTEGNAWIEAAEGQAVFADGEAIHIWKDQKFTSNVSGFNASSLSYEGGFWLASRKDSKEFLESDIHDGSSWNSIDYAIVTVRPDNIVSVYAYGGEVWAFCSNSAEVYYNSGASSFSFSKTSSGAMNEGLAAAGSPSGGANSVFWLSDKKTIIMASQGSPQSISPPHVNREIEQFARIDDAIGFTFAMDGHVFNVHTFPSANKTYVFDAATRNFYQWSSYPDDGRWRANCYASCWGNHLVGDYEDGLIYELDMDTYTDNGELITRQRSIPVETQSDKRVPIPSFEVKFETGTGISTGQGEDPQAMLQYSTDKGKTWSREIWRTIGKQGEHDSIVKWNRLGMHYHFTPRVTITDPVKVVMTEAHIK